MTHGRIVLVITPRSIIAIVLCAILVPARLFAQSPSVHYLYDSLNRLVAVVDQEGNAATYTYDAVGNILRIERFDTTGLPGAVAISMFTPSAGAVGTTVEVFGRGFGATIAQNSLFFAGRTADIIAASANRLVAKVPATATTGPISVAAPLGAATSARSFRVLGQFTITPVTVTVRVTGHADFVATESGSPVATVRWSVNGLPGGDATVGTITAEGIYAAPAAIPVPSVVTVTATHQDDATLSASASVAVVPALSVLAWSRPVSVAGAVAPLAFDRSVGAAVSVLSEAPRGVTLAVSTPISVEIEPVVLGVTPSSAVPGGPMFSLRIAGRGLSGATSLAFLRNNAVDPAVTVTNLSVNAEGTEATADVTIAAAAAAGSRVVQIATPGRASSPAGTGGNVFTVQ